MKSTSNFLLTGFVLLCCSSLRAFGYKEKRDHHGGKDTAKEVVIENNGLAQNKIPFAFRDTPSLPLASFRIVLGVKDMVERAWNGQVIPQKEQWIQVEADHFRDHQYDAKGWSPQGITTIRLGDPSFPNDYFSDSLSWMCSTRKSPMHGPTTEWHDHGQINHLHSHLVLKPVIQQPSFIIHINSPLDKAVRVTTSQGDFSFLPKDIIERQQVSYLSGNVRVELVPVVQRVTDKRPGQQDFPSICTTKSGDTWVSWQEYDNKDHDLVLARKKTGAGWSEVFVLDAQTDAFHTAIAEDSRSRIWAVWSAQVNGRWDLFARVFQNGSWAPTIKLTDGEATKNIYHRIVPDSYGNLWLVWQATANGFSQIQTKMFDGEKWGRPQQISQGKSANGNNWWPAIASGRNGAMAIAWDGYASGSYDVYVRRFERGQWLPEQAIAATSRFEAHPTVAFDNENRIWIAWDEAGENWGKDVGFLLEEKQATQLYGSREVGIACVQGNQLLTPKAKLSAVLDPHDYWELPHLQIGADGKPWLFVRHLVMREPDTPLEGPIDLALWEIYALQYTGSAWTRPMYLPRSSGRNDMMPSSSLHRDGTIVTVWATDRRDVKTFQPQQLVLEIGTIAKEKQTASLQLTAYQPRPGNPFKEYTPGETEQVKKIRAYKIQNGGKTYNIYRGDLHRHTDISVDGNADGSLLDAYRYARDAAALDFIGVADHTDNIWDTYNWWRNQKVADLYQIKNSFAALYGYERSVEYPNGHRNIFFSKRGSADIFPIGSFEARGYVGTGRLYKYLHRYNGFTIPHTTGRTSGTDWRDHDPEVEPVLELYQGSRDSYEYPGSPRPFQKYQLPDTTVPVPRASSSPKSPSFRPLGFAWHALSKGYQLGFIASSDHISTHISYACVIGEELSPEGLFEAIKARHTYASTDNIILDIKHSASTGTYLIGDVFDSKTPLQIKGTIIGTSEIEQIDIIKNNAVVQTYRPGQPEYTFQYSDQAYRSKEGESYYYVRVMQKDGNMAWGSPVWVTYKN